MTSVNPENPSRLARLMRLIWRLLPILGIASLITGLAWAVARMIFDVVAISLTTVGLGLFLTLFLKAEVANLKYYLHVIVYSLLVFGVCVVVYLFALQYTRQIDLTKQKFYSLSELTTRYLDRLAVEVEITIFDASSDPYREFFTRYTNITNKIHWRVVDPRTHPEEARRFGGEINLLDIMITSGEIKTKIHTADLKENPENALTNALMEVTQPKEVKIYFLTGHGEVSMKPAAAKKGADAGGRSQQSISKFLTVLDQRSIETAKLDLGETNRVPADASLVVIAGPGGDLMPKEKEWLEAYLERDGKLLVMLDIAPSIQPIEMPIMQSLLASLGLHVPNKIVLDLKSKALGASSYLPTLSWVNIDHPVTQKVRLDSLFMPEMRPVERIAKPQGIAVADLIRSSAYSWAGDHAQIMSQLALKVEPQPKSRDDLGPQPLGVAVSKPPPPVLPNMPAPLPSAGAGMRVVVFGTSALVRDTYYPIMRTVQELMLHSVNWLTEREDLIAVPPTMLEGTPIILKRAQKRLIFVLAVLVIPALLFFGGISYTQLRRRG